MRCFWGLEMTPETTPGWGNTTFGTVPFVRNTFICQQSFGGYPNLSLNSVGPATVVSFNHNGAGAGSISITTTTTAFNTASEICRLKEDLQTFDANLHHRLTQRFTTLLWEGC